MSTTPSIGLRFSDNFPANIRQEIETLFQQNLRALRQAGDPEVAKVLWAGALGAYLVDKADELGVNVLDDNAAATKTRQRIETAMRLLVTGNEFSDSPELVRNMVALMESGEEVNEFNVQVTALASIRPDNPLSPTESESVLEEQNQFWESVIAFLREEYVDPLSQLCFATRIEGQAGQVFSTATINLLTQDAQAYTGQEEPLSIIHPQEIRLVDRLLGHFTASRISPMMVSETLERLEINHDTAQQLRAAEPLLHHTQVPANLASTAAVQQGAIQIHPPGDATPMQIWVANEINDRLNRDVAPVRDADIMISEMRNLFDSEMKHSVGFNEQEAVAAFNYYFESGQIDQAIEQANAQDQARGRF